MVPVVLVEVGGVARSGHEYGDRTGIEYEFPAGRYEAWIRPGERFIYQVPRLGYVGCGVVGDIRPSAHKGRLVCLVHSTDFFDRPVALKDASGRYFEADPLYWKGPVYWGQGVRPLSDARFEAILAAASTVAVTRPSLRRIDLNYARPDVSVAVESYSVSTAIRLVQERFGEMPDVMPHNNPGYDLRVGTAGAPRRFLEVKGTQGQRPAFFITEGERLFAKHNADLYSLVIVFGIDLRKQTHDGIIVHDGNLDSTAFALAPSHWRGLFLQRESADRVGGPSPAGRPSN